MTSSSQVIEYTTYTNTRTGERWHERRVLDDSYSEVRGRELALLRAPPRTFDDRDHSNNAVTANDDLYALGRRQARWGEEGNDSRDSGALVVRRSRHDDRSSSGSRSPPRSRRGGNGRESDRRARSAHPPPPASNSNNNKKTISAAEQADPGVLWYSMRKRHEASWAERTFDSSYDGLIAGATGAAIGAITARRFGGHRHDGEEDPKRKWKVLGGAVAGAVAFNAAENWYRVYTEEREERKEKEREEEQEEEQEEER